MRWFIRIFLLLIFLGLAFLAIWPHLPTIERETKIFFAAWQSLRHSEPPIESANEPAQSAVIQTETPRRQILIPEYLNTEESRATEDPFIAETRQRAREDPQSAMEWLQNQTTGTQRLRGMLEVVALWAASDAESALLWLESNAQGLARLEALNSGVELWAESDPTAAAGWIDGMANDGSKLTAAKSLASKWVEQDPVAAVAWVAGLPTDSVRRETTRALAAAWVEKDPDAASRWAYESSQSGGNTDLLDETIRAYSQKLPAQAESFIRGLPESKPAQAARAAHVAGRAAQDPQATAEWLSALPPGDPFASDQHAENLLQIWAESDSIAASEWLSQIPSGARRDAAIVGFSRSIQRFEPEAALAWANAINQPERRRDQLTESIRLWLEFDPSAASQWIQSNDLDSAIRDQFADKINSPPDTP
jgi:hypothetical protein